MPADVLHQRREHEKQWVEIMLETLQLLRKLDPAGVFMKRSAAMCFMAAQWWAEIALALSEEEWGPFTEFMVRTGDFLSIQESLGYWSKQHTDADAAMTVMISLGGEHTQVDWAMPSLGYVLRLRPRTLCAFNPHALHGTCEPGEGQFVSSACLGDVLASDIWHLGGPDANTEN
jgi:hypothetical protein